jgi:hypothetical protein
MSMRAAVVGERRGERRLVESLDDAGADDRYRDGSEAEREELVVRAIVFFNVPDGERHGFA